MPLKLPENPRILVTRTDRIGDLVLTTPLLKALRERFPGAHLAVLVFLGHREIVEGNPFLDEVILYDKKGSERSLWGQFRFSQKLRSKKFDVVIHAHGTNRMHLAAWLAGIPVRIGYDRRAPWALTQVHAYNKKEGQKQESAYLFELLEPFGITPPNEIETFFPVSVSAVNALEDLLVAFSVPRDLPWIVLNPSASDATKMWPCGRFGELITKMQQDRPYVFFVIGTSQDQALAEKIKRATTALLIDLTGKLSLGMLGALLKKATLLVSNDSGPVHIAAALGTPVVSIFGRYAPGLGPNRWQPLSKRARVVAKDVSGIPESERKFTYIDEIPVQDVYQATGELLNECQGKK